MYTILVDGTNVMGDELETSVIDPTVTVGLNKAGTAEFTLPPSHPFYDYIEEMKSVVEIHEIDDQGIDDIIFYGRVSGTSRDWLNRKRVSCEGALAFFNDTIQRRKTYKSKSTTVESFFRDLIDRHNANYPEPGEGEEDIYKGMKFVVPENGVDIRDPQNPDVEQKNNTKKIYRMTDYQKTIDCLQEMCIDAEGGYLFVERDPAEEQTNIYWWSKMKYNDLNQDVQFGLNLLDLNQDFECDELYTALLPLGATYDTYKQITNPDANANPSEKGWYEKNDDGNYVSTSDESINNEHTYYKKEEKRKRISNPTGINPPLSAHGDYIQNDDAVAKYGFILATKSWDDISSAKKLAKKAQEWLNTERFDKMVITCNATDLSVVNPDYDKIKIGARVKVVSPKHGITEKIFPISEITYNLSNGKKEVTLGTQERKTLSYITSKGTKEYRMPDAYYDEDVDVDDDEEEEGGE